VTTLPGVRSTSREQAERWPRSGPRVRATRSLLGGGGWGGGWGVRSRVERSSVRKLLHPSRPPHPTPWGGVWVFGLWGVSGGFCCVVLLGFVVSKKKKTKKDKKTKKGVGRCFWGCGCGVGVGVLGEWGVGGGGSSSNFLI